MKLLLFGCFVCLALPFAATKHVICYKGQSYWCQNITTAVECNAVKHCIQSVWEQEVAIEKDDSSICQTCIDMVKLARDQLESNETQEEMRQVLEGICQVIPEKHLKHDCDKLMDDFGSYIVDTLASQMNPDIVCSVAGLCYSDKYKNIKAVKQMDCDGCNDFMKLVEGNIETASTADLHNVLVVVCRSLGSFSEVCTSLFTDHMESVDALIRNNIRASPVCDLAGVCSNKFHNHKPRNHKVPQSPVEVQVFKKPLTDDLACEFCEQLVHHLRDVLVANTTEEEFKMVLIGLCKMSKFKEQCDAYVDQYYDAVYYFLTSELDGKMLCSQIKICPSNSTAKVVRPEQQPQQLPIERMKLNLVPEQFLTSVGSNQAVCSFCEYLLHFIQEEITLPSSEVALTKYMEHICTKLPATIRGQCQSFFDTYMDQFIAILANKIDPSQVCPTLRACPTQLAAVEYKDKPTCPLCLLAMDGLIKKVGKDSRTELDIQDALGDLCMRDEFPTSVLFECVKFVQSFRGPITDMVMADFNSQESCVYINLCSPPADGMIPPPRQEENFDEASDMLIGAGDVATNEIHEKHTKQTPNVCVLCEFVMSKLAKELADKKTEEEIKESIYKVCSHMPKTIRDSCKQFVTQYADLILNLLIQEVSPKLICTELDLCLNPEIQIANPIKRCVLCEIFMDFLKTIITNDDVDEVLNKKMLKACDQFPRNDIALCQSMVEQLGPQIEAVLRQIPVGPLACRHLHMCHRDRATQQLQLLGVDLGPSCLTGAEYWCSSSENAVECDKVEYCEKVVWKSETGAEERKLKGADIM